MRNILPLHTGRFALYFYAKTTATIKYLPPSDLKNVGQPVLPKHQGLICKQRVTFSGDLLPSTDYTWGEEVSICSTNSLLSFVNYKKHTVVKSTIYSHNMSMYSVSDSLTLFINVILLHCRSNHTGFSLAEAESQECIKGHDWNRMKLKLWNPQLNKNLKQTYLPNQLIKTHWYISIDYHC